MIKNYLKAAFRTIVKNKVYSTINILGLCIGIWACMSVATVVINDLSFDTHWEKAEDLYRISTVKTTGSEQYTRMATSFAGLRPVLMNEFPEVEAVSSFHTDLIHFKLSPSASDIEEVKLLTADTTVWEMLDFQVLAGDPQTYIHDQANLVITRSFKDRYFPHEDPVGKTLTDVPSYERVPGSYLITGVIEDIPSNTHLRAEVVLVKKGRLELLNKKQFGTFQQNYVLLKPGVDPGLLAQKLSRWYADFVETDRPDSFELQSIKDIYLDSDFAEFQEVKGSLSTIYILSGVALLLLIIACVNFINLSAARAIQRMREIGVRKILGAKRRQLVFQFLTEAAVFFMFSTFCATFLYILTLPIIETYLGHELELTFVSRFYLFGITVLLLLLISLIAGGYPALLISGYSPANTIKGISSSGKARGQHKVRKVLVVLQFSISIIILVALLVVQQQVTFLKTKDVGFEKAGLLSIGAVSWDGKGDAFKTNLLQNPNILNVSLSSWIPTNGAGYKSKRIPDPAAADKSIEVFYISADVDFAETLGLQLQKGRLLNRRFPSDLQEADSGDISVFEEETSANFPSAIATSYTANVLQITSLGTRVSDVEVIPMGVVKDFNTESLKTKLKPTVITAEKSPPYSGMLIRTRPGAEQAVLTKLQKTWREFFPNKLLKANRVEELLAAQYNAEKKLQQLFAFFSGLSLFLAAMGVFGLIVQITEQQVKEIGIRKVLGASVQSIVMLFSKSFIKIVALAFVIASPIAWYATQTWLQNFPYRITAEWWVFALAGISTLLIALITVGFHAIKAAVVNPIKSLRTE